MSIQIIRCHEKYIPSFRECLGFVAKEEKYILLLEAPPLERVEEFIKENMVQDVPRCFAIENDQVIGWCDITPLKRDTVNHIGILGMGLLPLYRGKGIGAKLLKETLQWARERKLERIELEVFAHNKIAKELYQKFGFIEEGRRKKARKLKSEYEDIIVMGLIF